jgi:hypothetical protein
MKSMNIWKQNMNKDIRFQWILTMVYDTQNHYILFLLDYVRHLVF